VKSRKKLGSELINGPVRSFILMDTQNENVLFCRLLLNVFLVESFTISAWYFDDVFIKKVGEVEKSLKAKTHNVRKNVK